MNAVVEVDEPGLIVESAVLRVLTPDGTPGRRLARATLNAVASRGEHHGREHKYDSWDESDNYDAYPCARENETTPSRRINTRKSDHDKTTYGHARPPCSPPTSGPVTLYFHGELESHREQRIYLVIEARFADSDKPVTSLAAWVDFSKSAPPQNSNVAVVTNAGVRFIDSTGNTLYTIPVTRSQTTRFTDAAGNSFDRTIIEVAVVSDDQTRAGVFTSSLVNNAVLSGDSDEAELESAIFTMYDASGQLYQLTAPSGKGFCQSDLSLSHSGQAVLLPVCDGDAIENLVVYDNKGTRSFEKKDFGPTVSVWRAWLSRNGHVLVWQGTEAGSAAGQDGFIKFINMTTGQTWEYRYDPDVGTPPTYEETAIGVYSVIQDGNVISNCPTCDG
ncbi:MAG: hypothetical protein NFCOHLIN_01085 [Gammaproteobacteria bacterium]|nr:hypothetical protein [Gammaproteobacteria bacterium]